MNEQDILARLPGTADELRHSLGLRHEQIYEHLVRLENRGYVRVSVAYKHRGGRACVWESME